MLPTTAEALDASVACGRRLGLDVDEATVVAEGYSVRVLLRPAGVLTRVVTEGRALRPDPLPWMQREVAACRHLAGTGVAAARPWPDPGPHLVDGIEVSLWEWVEHRPGTVDAATFGRLLGDLHTALDGWDADLPLLVGPLSDVATALEVSDDPVLHRAAATLLPLARTWPTRPLHGDAHAGNVLLGLDGPVWVDLEDVCRGPAEWDLASLAVGAEAVAAYPGPLDADRLRDCRDLRRLQVLAALLVGWGDTAEEHALRERVGGALAARG